LVAGQDVEAGEDGVFRIARTVARDRLISTVDVEARHGHKSRARTFDGYKSHFSVDPDDELITNVAVTAANTADREVIDELLDEPATGAPAAATEPATAEDNDSDSQGGSESKDFEVYGDSAYAGGATLDEQTQRGHDMRTKVPPVRNAVHQTPLRPHRTHRHANPQRALHQRAPSVSWVNSFRASRRKR
jgi:Transposase DDE domain